MTGDDKVEIGVKKQNAIFILILTIVIVLTPLYFIDITKITSDDSILIIFYPIASIAILYYAYKYLFKRFLLGPIITLTRDSMIVKDDESVYNYLWTKIKKTKIEVVTEKDFEGKSVSRTMLTVWTTSKNNADEFNISDLEKKSDEIRDLINNYTEKYSR